MKFETISILAVYVLSVPTVLILHEYIHWVFAKLYNRKPSVKFFKFLTPSIQYRNNGNYFENLVIAASPALILTLFGMLIPQSISYLIVLKVFLLMNIFNFIPLTSDGEIIILSFMTIINRRKKKNEKES